MADDIKLKNTNINSGNEVSLLGAKLTYSYNNLTRSAPLVNKFELVETQYAGFENPKINISGFIDTNSTDTNLISQKYLIDFAKIKYDNTTPNTLYLKVNTGDKPTYLIGAESTTAATTSQYVKVVINDFKIDIDAKDSDVAYLWRYSLTLTETA